MGKFPNATRSFYTTASFAPGFKPFYGSLCSLEHVGKGEILKGKRKLNNGPSLYTLFSPPPRPNWDQCHGLGAGGVS